MTHLRRTHQRKADTSENGSLMPARGACSGNSEGPPDRRDRVCSEVASPIAIRAMAAQGRRASPVRHLNRPSTCPGQTCGDLSLYFDGPALTGKRTESIRARAGSTT